MALYDRFFVPLIRRIEKIIYLSVEIFDSLRIP